MAETFDYILQRKEPPRICFGSGMERKTFIDIQKFQHSVGPQTYKVRKFKKPRSIRGTPGLGNRAKRSLQIADHNKNPGPGLYDIAPPRVFKQSYAPFNSCAKKTGIPTKDGPGPTAHNAHKVDLCKKTRFDYNFGHPCIVPAVEMVCINYPTENCVKCAEPFEFGDHWHKNYSIYLCNFCMDEEHRLHEMFSEKELGMYKKIRTCSFKHLHEGTSAAVRLKSKHEIKKKINLENYLSLYMKCYGPKTNHEFKLPINAIL